MRSTYCQLYEGPSRVGIAVEDLLRRFSFLRDIRDETETNKLVYDKKSTSPPKPTQPTNTQSGKCKGVRAGSCTRFPDGLASGLPPAASKNTSKKSPESEEVESLMLLKKEIKKVETVHRQVRRNRRIRRRRLPPRAPFVAGFGKFSPPLAAPREVRVKLGEVRFDLASYRRGPAVDGTRGIVTGA